MIKNTGFILNGNKYIYYIEYIVSKKSQLNTIFIESKNIPKLLKKVHEIEPVLPIENLKTQKF